MLRNKEPSCGIFVYDLLDFWSIPNEHAWNLSSVVPFVCLLINILRSNHQYGNLLGFCVRPCLRFHEDAVPSRFSTCQPPLPYVQHRLPPYSATLQKSSSRRVCGPLEPVGSEWHASLQFIVACGLTWVITVIVVVGVANTRLPACSERIGVQI